MDHRSFPKLSPCGEFGKSGAESLSLVFVKVLCLIGGRHHSPPATFAQLVYCIIDIWYICYLYYEVTDEIIG